MEPDWNVFHPKIQGFQLSPRAPVITNHILGHMLGWGTVHVFLRFQISARILLLFRQLDKSVPSPGTLTTFVLAFVPASWTQMTWPILLGKFCFRQ